MKLDRLLSLALLALAAGGAGVARAEPDLLPRQVLFGAPAHSWPQLSPDGRRLAFLAPSPAGVMNVWVGPTKGEGRQARMLTGDHARGVYGYRWAEDNRHILYWQDRDGDEAWHLFSVEVATGRTRDLTPYPRARMQNLVVSPKRPHEVLVGLDLRTPGVFDIYRLNLESGEIVLRAQNPGDVLSWTADANLQVRAATAFDPARGETSVRIRARDGAWRDLARWPFGDSMFLGQINGGSVVPTLAEGSRIYTVSASGANASRLAAVDMTTGASRIAAAGPCDVAETPDDDATVPPPDLRPLALKNPVSGRLEAIGFECAERHWRALKPTLQLDLDRLRDRLGGFPYVISRDRADREWVVATRSGNRPVEYSLYARRSKTLRPLFSEQPRLKDAALPAPKAVQIAARDGVSLPAYLTRPTGEGPRPMILLPHGGPWYRDHDDFDPIVQLFANRGYAVLQVEYRGSTGFGKGLLNAGDHEYGLKMRDDLIDATQWAIDQGIADPKRIAVFGISAGGYLALRVTEARPDLFRATIDVVGPTDVAYTLQTMPTNWRAVRARWVRRIGDVVADPDLNAKLSVRFDGTKPSGAFLIAQGANDPRVNRRNSDAIVSRLRAQGVPVTYVVYSDEGHGFVRPANNLDFYGRVEAFLAATLGGRAEPRTAEPGAKAEVQ